MYDLYKIANIPILVVFAFLIGLFGIISILTIMFSKSERDKGVSAVLEDLNINKFLAIILVLCSAFVLFFSNNTLVWLIDGKTDMRLAPEGTYCYYTRASRDDSSKTYTLPAKINKTDGKYYVENVYFSNGGYLYFDSGDYIEYDETFYSGDQNGELWRISLTNKKAFKNSVYEKYEVSVINLALTLLAVFSLAALVLLILFSKPKNAS